MSLEKVFLGVTWEQEKQLPFGLKYTRMVNSIVAVWSFLSFYFAMIKSMFDTYAQRLEVSGMAPNASNLSAAKVTAIFLFLFVVLLPIILIKMLNDRLVNLNKTARKIQVWLSFLFLIWTFPIGTIFYLGCLYFMLFDSKTKNVFL